MPPIVKSTLYNALNKCLFLLMIPSLKIYQAHHIVTTSINRGFYWLHQIWINRISLKIIFVS